MTTVSHGQDPERVDAVGEALGVLAERVDGVSQTGRAGVVVLADAWGGPDAERFAGEWSGAESALASAAQVLRETGRIARTQAADQRSASEGAATGGAGAPRGGARAVTAATGALAGATGGVLGADPEDFGLPEDYEDGPEIPFSDKGQVPQGMSYDPVNDELVYTFYDEDDDTDGEIVFVDRETGEVTSRVPLRGQDHYGGVAVHGEYTYVSGGGDVQVYRTEDLRDPEQTSVELPGLGSYPVTVPAEPIDTVDTAAHSTVTVHNDELYVTQFTEDENTPGTMYRYEIGADGSPVGDPVGEYAVPPQTQGVSFDEAGNAYFAQSYGRGNTSTLTQLSPSELQDGGWHEGAGTSQTIPNMAEGNVIIDGQLYQLYESGADKYDDYTGPDGIVEEFAGELDPRDRVTVHDLRR
ncbi:hypothetical protein GCM10027055_23430 [Janibacter alkaliphilus]|uniref:Uncharacterized protein YukE n=1 Tax=Janibacter alkaliphilus TaxID=1069963 RepID=A0A852XJ48_9MICO|nr:hypothetical protein [Janibacter alkaliphilus]NYG38351.1 uncharacterized protein YukE [Janibacter alkaliphilus]